MSTQQIGFIGAGNMNCAIIGGLIKAGVSADSLIASDPNQPKLDKLSSTAGIHVTRRNLAVAEFADVVVLGVKPDYIATVCSEIADKLTGKLLISVAAGITTEQIVSWSSPNQPIIRVMPNTPCLYGVGAIGAFANQLVTDGQRQIAANIFATTGTVVWVEDEAQMDLVTAISGSGPAYYFYFAEAMLAAAKQHGMSDETARTLVHQTMLGAATMLQNSELNASALREAVTSPGGTTAAALQTMTDHSVANALIQAVNAAVLRGQELSQQSND